MFPPDRVWAEMKRIFVNAKLPTNNSYGHDHTIWYRVFPFQKQSFVVRMQLVSWIAENKLTVQFRIN